MYLNSCSYLLCFEPLPWFALVVSLCRAPGPAVWGLGFHSPFYPPPMQCHTIVSRPLCSITIQLRSRLQPVTLLVIVMPSLPGFSVAFAFPLPPFHHHFISAPFLHHFHLHLDLPPSPPITSSCFHDPCRVSTDVSLRSHVLHALSSHMSLFVMKIYRSPFSRYFHSI